MTCDMANCVTERKFYHITCNVRGMASKSSAFLQFVTSTMYPIYIITETWFNESINDLEFFPREYFVYRCDRSSTSSSKSGGGGVLIAIHASIPSEVVMSNSTIEQVCVQVKILKRRIIFALYIPPRSTTSAASSDIYISHCESISNILTNASDEDQVVIMGDFNLPNVNWVPDDESSCLLPCGVSSAVESICIDSLLSIGLYQINYILNNRNRILDLTFINILDVFVVSESLNPFVVNDVNHKSMDICINTVELLPAQGLNGNVVEFFYDFKRADSEKLNSYLESQNWPEILSSDNSNVCVEMFYDVLSMAFENFVPVSKKQNSIQPPWFDSHLINLKNKKNKAYTKWKKEKLEVDKTLYSNLAKEFNVYYQQVYSHYISQMQSHINKDPKRFWSFVNSKRKTNNLPSSMVYKDKKLENSNDICEEFANFFQSVYLRHDYSREEFHDSIVNTNLQITIPFIEPNDIIKALKSFKDGCGPDCVPTFIVKQLDTVLATPLSILFNKSLSTGIFPDVWKISRIVPIFKSGNRNNVTNYRGVSILSAIPKLFEVLVCDVLYFQVKNLITDKQHGFCSGRSTTTNLVEFSRKVINNMEAKAQTDVIYFDFSKAFDSLSHELIIKKLRTFGFGEGFLQWIYSYLTGRKQYISIDGIKSKEIDVYSGVPQGSHLGPLIFILFVNDIPKVVRFSECLLYADDIKLYRTVNSSSDVGRLQHDINMVGNWCERNMLSLNVKKCKIMSYYRISNPVFANYLIGNEILERMRAIKDLGITFTTSMSFNLHMDTIIAKAMSMLGFIRRITREFTEPSVFRQLYCAFVRSQLEYASIVWSPHYDSYIKRIESVQKKFLISFAYKSGHISPSTEIPFWEKVKNLPAYLEHCKAVRIESLETRRHFAGSLLVSDLLCGKLNCPFLLESINICVPRMSSRKHEFLTLEYHKTNYGSNEPIGLMSKYFNLFSNVFDFDSKYEFKKRLKSTAG